MMNTMKYRRGQAAIIVALLVIIGLTLAVGIAGRSVTSVSVSTQEQEHARAFSAAEAGAEDALRQNLSALVGSTLTVSLGESQVSYQVSRLSSATANINPGQVVSIDWNSGTETSVNVSWSGCSQLATTTITSAGGVRREVTALSPSTITKVAGDRLVRIRFVNCTTIPTPITVTGNTAGATLSFYKIDSFGSSAIGNSSSRVQAVRSELEAPGIMDYAIFSGGDIQ